MPENLVTSPPVAWAALSIASRTGPNLVAQVDGASNPQALPARPTAPASSFQPAAALSSQPPMPPRMSASGPTTFRNDSTTPSRGFIPATNEVRPPDTKLLIASSSLSNTRLNCGAIADQADAKLPISRPKLLNRLESIAPTDCRPWFISRLWLLICSNIWPIPVPACSSSDCRPRTAGPDCRTDCNNPGIALVASPTTPSARLLICGPRAEEMPAS